MTNKSRKNLAAFFLILICSFNLMAPQSAYARISFRKFFRSMRRATRFVVNLPHKATRFLGPTLGPIAADIICINLGKNPKFGAFFTKARKIDKIATNIEEQNKLIKELKQMYDSQADQLDQKAAEIKEIRKSLAAELIKGNITREEHLERVADLVEISKIYEDSADKLRRSGDRLNPAHIVKILGDDFFKTSILKIKNLIETETASEINRLIDPSVIENIVSGSGSLEDVIGVLLSDDLDRIKKNFKDFDFDQFKDKLMEKIKKMLEEDKDALKENWQQKMEELIQQQIEEEKLPVQPTKKEQKTDKQQVSDEVNDSSGSNEKCKPGYVFHPRSGVGCVQEDCYKGNITDGHLSYTGSCVCGSSGSIKENPKDPNKECSYDLSYSACPGCVYACVHLDEECPAPL